MAGYGQFCPIAKAAQVLAERWTPLVLRELICGSTRFNDLRRGVPLMSSSLLSQRLKFLEREGVIERQPAAAGRGFEYHLTVAGRELEPMIMLMGEWGARWVRSQLEPEDLDVTLLMWDMHRTVRPEHFPARRVVVAFEFTDVPQNKATLVAGERRRPGRPVHDRPGPRDRSGPVRRPADHDRDLDRRSERRFGIGLGARSRRTARRSCAGASGPGSGSARSRRSRASATGTP